MSRVREGERKKGKKEGVLRHVLYIVQKSL